MARTNGLDKLSVAQLLDLQKRIEAAIVTRKATDAAEVKGKMQALAEKSGFSLAELFGGKRALGPGVRPAKIIASRNRPNTSSAARGVNLTSRISH